MEIQIRKSNNINSYDVLIIPIWEDSDRKWIANQYLYTSIFFEKNENHGKLGESFLFHSLERNCFICLLGAGKFNCSNDARKLARSIMAKISEISVKSAIISILHKRIAEANYINNFLDYLHFNAYIFSKKKLNKVPPEILAICFDNGVELNASMLDRQKIVSKNVNFVRDLVNDSPSTVNPNFIVKIVEKLAHKNKWCCSILRQDELLKEGYNGIFTIGKSSIFEPALISLSYKPTKFKRSVAFIGKGITFDSGGLNIKNVDSMKYMKSDMAGAAVALGVIKAASELSLPVKIQSVLAISENLPGPSSYKQGDIITYNNGTSVEVLNTDAEGRLALADALLRASLDNPDFLVAISTLTGSIYEALGDICAGMICNNSELSTLLNDAGNSTGERLLQFPMFEEYKEDIVSKIADLKNSGYGGEGARPF